MPSEHGIGERFCSRMADGTARRQQQCAPPEAALIKSRLFAVAFTPRESALSFFADAPVHGTAIRADAGNQTDYAAKQTDSARKKILPPSFILTSGFSGRRGVLRFST